MTAILPLDLERVVCADFEIRTDADELRADDLCVRLLLAVRDRLLRDGTLDPLEVGTLCRGADYFLREFVIAECHDNLFHLPPERVRQFAGHWYIVRNLEPNAGELAAILAGVCALYHLLAEQGLVAPELAAAIGAACTDLAWYQQRVEQFWAIEADGFAAWRAACPLPRPQR